MLHFKFFGTKQFLENDVIRWPKFYVLGNVSFLNLSFHTNTVHCKSWITLTDFDQRPCVLQIFLETKISHLPGPITACHLLTHEHFCQYHQFSVTDDVILFKPVLSSSSGKNKTKQNAATNLTFFIQLFCKG